MQLKPTDVLLPVIDLTQGLTKQYKDQKVGKTTRKVICHLNGEVLIQKHLDGFKKVRERAPEAQVLLLLREVPGNEAIQAVRDILHEEQEQFLCIYMPNDKTEFQCPVFEKRVLLDVKLRAFRNLSTIFGPMHVLAFKPAAIGDVRNYHELIASRAASLHFLISDEMKGAERMREQLEKLSTSEEFDEDIYDFERPNPKKASATVDDFDDEDEEEDLDIDPADIEDMELDDEEEEEEVDLSVDKDDDEAVEEEQPAKKTSKKKSSSKSADKKSTKKSTKKSNKKSDD